jgi:hypothetical protein
LLPQARVAAPDCSDQGSADLKFALAPRLE